MVKKFFSIFFFVLMILIFIFDLYGGITGAIEANNKFAEIRARGGGGMEFLAVGADLVVFGVIFISLVGYIISIISCVLAQYRVIRAVSVLMCLLYPLPFLICIFIFAM